MDVSKTRHGRHRRKHNRNRVGPGYAAQQRSAEPYRARHTASPLRYALVTSACVAMVTGTFSVYMLARLLRNLPSVNAQTFTSQSVGSTVYDVHGKVIGIFARDGDREPIGSLHEVAQPLVQAFIAAEDRTFYRNHGVSPQAIARALVQNLMGGRIYSGASTITQQTVKLAVFPEQPRTIRRKVQEIALSLQVDRMLTKSEILTDYMNWVYMGRFGTHNVYGVKSAAWLLFHKQPSRLTLPEAAYLAAIPNNPSYFSPYAHADHTTARQHYILAQMLRNQMISRKDYNRAIQTPIHPQFVAATADRYPYIMAEVERTAARELAQVGLYASASAADAALPTVGYQIYTTIDLDVQDRMDAVLNDDGHFRNSTRTQAVHGNKQADLVQAAMVLEDNATGGLVALDGGRPAHFAADQIDHAETPRQPGSTIKPLVVYGPAIENGLLTAGTQVNDGPAIFAQGLPWQYQPMDDLPYWHGWVTVRQALVESLNLPAIRILHRLTPEAGTAYLGRVGIQPGDLAQTGQPTLVDADTHHLSSAIGGLQNGLTLKQLTGAFTIFPNQGIWRQPLLVKRISTNAGDPVYVAHPLAKRAISVQTAFLIHSMLRDVVAKPMGTAAAIGRALPHLPIAGKTGTTDDRQNGWFVGYTPTYTLGIWMGYNHNEPIPATLYPRKFDLWQAVFRPVAKVGATEQSGVPANLIARSICRKSGLLATPACEAAGTTYHEWYVKGTEPRAECPVHDASGAVHDEAMPILVDGVIASVYEDGVHLRWRPFPGATLYSLWRADSPTGPFTEIGRPSALPFSVDPEGSHGSSTRYYQVHAEMADGTAVPSATVSVAQGTTPLPGSPLPEDVWE